MPETDYLNLIDARGLLDRLGERVRIVSAAELRADEKRREAREILSLAELRHRQADAAYERAVWVWVAVALTAVLGVLL